MQIAQKPDIWQTRMQMDILGEIIATCQVCSRETIVTLNRAHEKSYARCRHCKAFLFEYLGIRGYIYVLSNPKMQGLFKIGLSERPLAERIAELSSATGVPAPFELEAAFASADPQLHERQIHDELAEYRVPGREFFTVHITKAISVAESACGCPPFYVNPKNKQLLSKGKPETERRIKSLDAWQEKRFNE